jgi:hypothetical protein
MRCAIYIYILVLSIFCSCNEHEYHIICSPDKTKYITVEDITAMRPGFKPYLRLYLGKDSLNKDEYIEMHFDDVRAFGINWGVSPIVINTDYAKNTIPSYKIIIKEHLSESEEKSYNAPGSLWRTYDFESLMRGEFDNCK